MTIRNDRSILTLVLLSLFTMAGVAYLRPAPQARADSKSQVLVLYGFSVLDGAFKQGLLPVLQERWRMRTGERVRFITSFDGLGKITNELLTGAPAHIALLSTELGARQLADAGIIAHDGWTRLPHGGVFARTPFIIVVRPGNPHAIQDFQDLARPGVKVVHPDPKTSGGAYWGIFAEHGAGVRRGGSWQAGHDLLLGIWKNVVAKASSAREARILFENGVGDALVTYESDALEAKSNGTLQGELIYPRSTIASESTLVVLEQNLEPASREVVDALVEILWSNEGQRILAAHGFRSVEQRHDGESDGFAKIEDLFRIEDLGGWKQARRDIIEGAFHRVLKELEK
jgi:ABC-type sulfate transport system substrate-binding protein